MVIIGRTYDDKFEVEALISVGTTFWHIDALPKPFGEKSIIQFTIKLLGSIYPTVTGVEWTWADSFIHVDTGGIDYALYEEEESGKLEVE